MSSFAASVLTELRAWSTCIAERRSYHFPQSCNVLLQFKLKFSWQCCSPILGFNMVEDNWNITHIVAYHFWKSCKVYLHWGAVLGPVEQAWPLRPGWGWGGQGQRDGSALSYPTKCPPNPPAYSLDWRVPRFQLLFSQIISLIARVRGGWEWPLLSSVATPPTPSIPHLAYLAKCPPNPSILFRCASIS